MFKWLEQFLHHEKTTSKQEKVISFLLALAYLFGIGALSPHEPGAFYEGLIKPSATPPDIVFMIVWTILFVFLALSFYHIWNFYRSALKRKIYLFLYLFNGFLIFWWSDLFFSQNDLNSALLVSIGLLITGEIMAIIGFYVNKKGAYLLLPYIAWIFFAIYLNASIITLN